MYNFLFIKAKNEDAQRCRVAKALTSMSVKPVIEDKCTILTAKNITKNYIRYFNVLI